MTPLQRKLLRTAILMGAALTLVVVALDRAGALAPIERWFYDMRTWVCQYYMPPPSDRLVHLDINDRSLEQIGRWPWHRTEMARIIDELNRAGARTIGLDIVFAEPEEPRIVRDGATYDQIYDDAVLAESLDKFGAALVPVMLEDEPRGPAMTAAIEEMAQDLEIDKDQLIGRLRARKVANVEQVNDDFFVKALRRAMWERVTDSLGDSDKTLAEVRKEVFPNKPQIITEGHELKILKEQYDRAVAMRRLQRYARPRSWADVNDVGMAAANVATPPVSQLAEASAGTGFVNYEPDPDGVVRAVPLWVSFEGKFYPQLGFALACSFLGIDPASVRLEGDEAVVPRNDGTTVRIPLGAPVANPSTSLRRALQIPWFGGREWQAMYDVVTREKFLQHVPADYVWQAAKIQGHIAGNNRTLDDAIRWINNQLGLKRVEEHLENPPSYDDPNSRDAILAYVKEQLNLPANKDLIDSYRAAPPDELEKGLRDLLRSIDVDIVQIPLKNAELATELRKVRGDLAAKFNGRAVLIGWTAIGAIADFVPTSLHAKCPGVVIHGVMFNSIINGEFWRIAPAWVTVLFTVVLGMTTALAVGLLSPFKSLPVALLLAGLYLLANGLWLFDYGNTIVGVAGPVLAIAVVYAGGSGARVYIESAELARITRRFGKYVDPKLVNFVVNNPTIDVFKGQEREMTVIFTDLAGFTTITERLGPRAVELLNEFMGDMVPVIRDKHDGYVNKFLGDGIMFFFNAPPMENPRHASAAIATVLAMFDQLALFNERIKQRDLPPVGMRVGISTGDMVVGDAGSPEASDYTVLGDNVNLAARLESANKAVGTRIIISQRTREMVDDEFLFRPIGKIQVVGKTEGIIAYEVLNWTEQATDVQRKMAQCSKAVVDAFCAGDFAGCLKHIAQMEADLGPSKFTKMYHELCEDYLKEPPGAGFDGVVVLQEK